MSPTLVARCTTNFDRDARLNATKRIEHSLRAAGHNQIGRHGLQNLIVLQEPEGSTVAENPLTAANDLRDLEIRKIERAQTVYPALKKGNSGLVS